MKDYGKSVHLYYCSNPLTIIRCISACKRFNHVKCFSLSAIHVFVDSATDQRTVTEQTYGKGAGVQTAKHKRSNSLEHACMVVSNIVNIDFSQIDFELVTQL